MQDAGEGGAQPLAAGEHADREVGAVAAEEEAGQQVHPLGLGDAGGVRGEVLGDGAVGVEQVEPLREMGDAALGVARLAALRFQGAVEQAQQGRLPGAVGAGQRDALGSADRQVEAVAGEELLVPVADAQPLALEDGPSGGDLGVRQLQDDPLLVADGAPGLVEPGLRLAEPGGVGLSGASGGLLRAALHVPGEDLRQSGALEVAGGVALAPLRPLPGLLEFALLPLQLLLGAADVLLGDLLLPAHGFLVRGEVAAEEAHPAGVQFGDPVHPVQERAVVADQQQAAVPLLQYAVQVAAGVEVEVVGGFVQEQHIGAAQELGGEAEGDDLAAAEGGEAPVQGEVAEAEPVELGAGAFLDVPVVADGGEVLLAHVARLDGVEGGDHGGDAEHLGDGQLLGEGETLREVPERAAHLDAAGAGAQLSGDQLEQGALAGAVRGDEAGTARADGERQAVEDGGVVRPGEGQVGNGDEGVGHAADLKDVTRVREGAAPRRTERRERRHGHQGGTALSARRWPSAPGITRRCRRHPPCLVSLRCKGRGLGGAAPAEKSRPP